MCVSVGDEVLVDFKTFAEMHPPVSQLNPLTLGNLILHVYIINVLFGKSFVNRFNQ